jgi:hypothetical protein
MSGDFVLREFDIPQEIEEFSLRLDFLGSPDLS